VYRDLIPGRMGGRLIASHIRLTTGGEVPDYVHNHKVRFQMIYCLKGSIKVVYEDQGPPFWLNPGDCVLQPPEIRHRVLECSAGSEVIEIGMPAVHETWVEHLLALPTSNVRPHRTFGGQEFVRHIAAAADWNSSTTDDFEFRDTEIMAATGGLADVRVIGAKSDSRISLGEYAKYGIRFVFVLNGTVALEDGGADDVEINAGNGLALKASRDYTARVETGTEFLLTAIERA
jgi:quercetin dioxygenase-like cupin family protein